MKTNKKQKIKNKTFTEQMTNGISQLCARPYTQLIGSRFCICGHLMQPQDQTKRGNSFIHSFNLKDELHKILFSIGFLH